MYRVGMERQLVPLRSDEPAPRLPLGYTIAFVGQLTAAGFRDALAPQGVNPRQFAILSALSSTDGLTQSRLSETLGIPPSGVVSLLDELEAAGSVARKSAPLDRRVRHVHLTDHGRTLMVALVEVAEGFQRTLVASLTPDEQSMMRRLLDRIAGNLGVDSGGPIQAW